MGSSGGGTDTTGRAGSDVFDRLWHYRVPILVGFAFVLGLVVSYRFRPVVLYDDAAITMRYASRIASGDGWTYNDGDRTNGASAPLYTMVLAFLDLIGFNIVTAARLVGALSVAASFSLVAFLASRISGFFAGCLATLFLLSWIDFQTQGLSGMESAFAAALGLAVIAALREDNDTWAGVLLGLALLNKLDAGLLAVAVAIAYLVVVRKPPWRIAVISGAILLPWLVFAQIYFGSGLPHSFTQKASGEVASPVSTVSPTWILDLLQRQQVMLLVVLALASLAVVLRLRRDRPRSSMALLLCVVWPLLHGLAFSFIDLGDAYPWYLTVLYPPICIAAGCALGSLLEVTQGAARPIGVAVVVAVAIVGIGFTSPRFGQIGVVADTMREGHTPNEYEAFERARREAAVQLAALVEPGDVILTCFGWVAFEAPEANIDEQCPLNTQKEPGKPRWMTYSDFPTTNPPSLPPGAVIVNTIYPEGTGGGRVDIIELDPDEPLE